MNHVSAQIEKQKGERPRFGRREPPPLTEPNRQCAALGFIESRGLHH